MSLAYKIPHRNDLQYQCKKGEPFIMVPKALREMKFTRAQRDIFDILYGMPSKINIDYARLAEKAGYSEATVYSAIALFRKRRVIDRELRPLKTDSGVCRFKAVFHINDTSKWIFPSGVEYEPRSLASNAPNTPLQNFGVSHEGDNDVDKTQDKESGQPRQSPPSNFSEPIYKNQSIKNINKGVASPPALNSLDSHIKVSHCDEMISLFFDGAGAFIRSDSIRALRKRLVSKIGTFATYATFDLATSDRSLQSSKLKRHLANERFWLAKHEQYKESDLLTLIERELFGGDEIDVTPPPMEEPKQIDEPIDWGPEFQIPF